MRISIILEIRFLKENLGPDGVQWNFKGSNTDDLFTTTISNSFSSP